MVKYLYFKVKDSFDIIDSEKIISIAKIIDNITIHLDDYQAIRKYASKCQGIDKEIEISVMDAVSTGRKYWAITIYRRENPGVTFAEARAEIERIMELDKL